jgi:ankyrin repeat protein
MLSGRISLTRTMVPAGGETPVMMAACALPLATPPQLLCYPAYTHFTLAVPSDEGDCNTLKILLDAGANGGLAHSLSGETALHIAAGRGKAACVRHLLAADVPPPTTMDL